jgi:Protein of unknown function (DUF3341)
MTPPNLHGIMAEFDEAEGLARAVEAARGAGYRRLEAFSPFPLKNVAVALGARPAAIPWIAGIAGLVGAGVQYGAQYWLNGVDYPLNVGGRPLNSWPAFIPSTLIVAILWAGAATLLSLLFLLKLPRLHHPVFAVPGFERASEDRFFLLILSSDPLFESGSSGAFLEELSSRPIREVVE